MSGCHFLYEIMADKNLYHPFTYELCLHLRLLFQRFLFQNVTLENSVPHQCSSSNSKAFRPYNVVHYTELFTGPCLYIYTSIKNTIFPQRSLTHLFYVKVYYSAILKSTCCEYVHGIDLTRILSKLHMLLI